MALKVHLGHPHYQWCGTYGPEDSQNILDVTCKRCLRKLAQHAGLDPTTPVQIIADKLQELQKAKMVLVLDLGPADANPLDPNYYEEYRDYDD